MVCAEENMFNEKGRKGKVFSMRVQGYGLIGLGKSVVQE